MGSSFWSDVEEYVREGAAAHAAASAVAERREDADRPGAAAKLVRSARLWLRVRRQRRELLSLDDELLRDIGLSRADAIREVGGPVREPVERVR